MTTLQPYTHYKDSGIDWLGKIPAHWEVKRVKDVAQVNKEVLSEQTDKLYTFDYIDISNVDNTGVINKPERMEFAVAPSRARRIVRKNDVIVSTVRTYLKAVAFFDYEPKDIIVSTGFAVLSSCKSMNPRYLAYLAKSDIFVDSVICHSIGVSYPAINTGTLTKLHVCSPPLTEQARIAAYLDEKTQKIDAIRQPEPTGRNPERTSQNPYQRRSNRQTKRTHP